MKPAKAPFSADSHTIETPAVYRDFVEAKFKNRVPALLHDSARGAMYQVEGIAKPVAIGAVCMADVPYAERGKRVSRPFEELLHGGYDAKARLADQDRDGICGEIIYPSLGMVICQVTDPEFRHAMLWAYNRWLQGFVEAAPDRLIGIPQLAVRSVEDAVTELKEIKRMGFRGAMLPGDPLTKEDYDDPIYDPLWRTAVELDLPLSFHSLTSARAVGANIQSSAPPRGSSIIGGLSNIPRSNQDMISLLIWGGVFDRHPKLKMICVEADAGWAPYLMLKMDQYYRTYRDILKVPAFSRLPSEMFKENIYMTFQYDWVACRIADMMNPERLMWANDYPHSDGTWPNSQALLQENIADMPEARASLILRDNVMRLYKLAA